MKLKNYERVVMRGGGRGNTFDGFIKPGPQTAQDKPLGLWYGIDDSWLAWCESEQQNWIGHKFYRLDVDPSKLLMIGRDMSLDEFDKRFAVSPPWSHDVTKQLSKFATRFYIDWPKVAEMIVKQPLVVTELPK